MTEYVRNVVIEEPKESFEFNLTLDEQAEIYKPNNQRLINHHDLFDTKLRGFYTEK